MDIDDLIDSAGIATNTSSPNETTDDRQDQSQTADERERLAAIISGGQSQRYLGKSITLSQLDGMDVDEMRKLYARYEAKLGAELIEPLKEYSRRAYAWVAGLMLKRVSNLELNQSNLVSDFEKNQSIDHAITRLCCTVHHKYGMFLAPLLVVLTTAMNVEGQLNKQPTNENDRGNTVNTNTDTPDRKCS